MANAADAANAANALAARGLYDGPIPALRRLTPAPALSWAATGALGEVPAVWPEARQGRRVRATRANAALGLRSSCNAMDTPFFSVRMEIRSCCTLTSGWPGGVSSGWLQQGGPACGACGLLL